MPIIGSTMESKEHFFNPIPSNLTLSVPSVGLKMDKMLGGFDVMLGGFYVMLGELYVMLGGLYVCDVGIHSQRDLMRF
jgi:hypothetical protein